YTFTGWTLTELGGVSQTPGAPNLATVITKGSIENREYTANWMANTDTTYTVEHYQENIDGTYTVFETENLVGETDTIVTATVKTYEGYTENTTHTDRVISGTITSDGNLILKVYYSRNEYNLTLIPGANVQSVEGQGNSGLGDGVQLQPVALAPVPGTVQATFKFGQNVDINSVLQTETGYTITFEKWESDNTGLLPNNTNQTTSITMPKGDITLTAKAIRTINNYNYTVEYYYDNVINNTATITESAEFASVITYPSAGAPEKLILGYELDLTKGTNGVQGSPLTITEIEGNNIIKVYYKEIIYSIDYELNDGALDLGDTNPSTYTVNSENITLNNPIRQGYTFTGWTLTELGGVSQTP
ncbi:MAG TPA: InlB B-repeat-containing protein, partial [Bacteroidales bacterium]|nr:InlB B-repeat-containing protein [Bacteroidales bacterium]